jgi:hypothetical protein
VAKPSAGFQARSPAHITDLALPLSPLKARFCMDAFADEARKEWQLAECARIPCVRLLKQLRHMQDSACKHRSTFPEPGICLHGSKTTRFPTMAPRSPSDTTCATCLPASCHAPRPDHEHARQLAGDCTSDHIAAGNQPRDMFPRTYWEQLLSNIAVAWGDRVARRAELGGRGSHGVLEW